MKKIVSAILITMVMMYSCSTPAYVEKETNSNLSNYKTYMWVDLMTKENGPAARAAAFADLSVRNAVNAELQRWGWKEANENPGVLISYDILVEKNVERKNDPLYTQPYSRFYYNRFSKRWSAIYYPSQFLGYDQYQVDVKEATVTITMMDAENDKKIWQGWTTERLGSSGITNLNVKKSVRNIFKKTGTPYVANK
jgi:hypothetical protein